MALFWGSGILTMRLFEVRNTVAGAEYVVTLSERWGCRNQVCCQSGKELSFSVDFFSLSLRLVWQG